MQHLDLAEVLRMSIFRNRVRLDLIVWCCLTVLPQNITARQYLMLNNAQQSIEVC